MYLFDLHCDTITRLHTGERLAPGDTSLRRNAAHIALERMAGLNWCQCFAIFMPDHLRGAQAAAYFEETYHYFCEQMAANSDLTRQVRGIGEVEAAFAAGKAAAMLTVEGASALAGDLSRVRRLADCGVKLLTLTWNAANELAGGCVDGGGFTAFGRAAVGALERAGIVLDVSHLSDKAFWELCEFATLPFVASHSNSRAVCSHPRNLTDAQFLEIVRRGGLVGLNFYVKFLAEGGSDPPFAAMAAHIAHFLALGGADTLALGSDYDGADIPAWLCPAEKVRDLYLLVAAEFGEALADKLFYQNAADFWKRRANQEV